jgi:hypothetical protein
MRAMKPTPIILGALLGALLAYVSPARAEYPAQNGCVSETHTCSSGSCSRAIPDGGWGLTADGGFSDTMDAGISLNLLKGYTVRICGTAARPLAGAGSLVDYHCKAKSTCSSIPLNTQPVTLVGTAATLCQESPTFVVPNYYPAGDRMVWATSGVTITGYDGGVADTVTLEVCPVQ